jgi:hypothetical protein
MTTTSPRRDPGPLIMWLGHYQPVLIACCLPVLYAGTLSGNPPLQWAGAAVCVPYMGAMFASVIHDSRLCERCAAATPLDPQAAVARWRPALWGFHRLGVPVLVVALAVWVVGGLVHGRPWWEWPVYAVVLASIGVSVWATAKHRDLYPWCPWCRWRDGGDEEEAPDPAPAPEVHVG